MATEQTLRGSANKIFSISANFNKGLDKRTADDVSSDQSFKELSNFYNEADGYLSKRPGIYNTHIKEFIGALATGAYDDTKYVIGTNRFGETKEQLVTKLQDLYNTVFLGVKKIGQEYEGTKFAFTADKAIGFQLLKNKFFLEAMQDYEALFSGEYSDNIRSKKIEFSCIMAIGGFYTTIKNEVESKPKHGLYICRLKTELSYNETNSENEHWDVNFEIDTVDSTMNPYKDANNEYQCRWDFVPDGYLEGDTSVEPANTLDISNYNGLSYIATGSNYIIRIEQNPETKTPTTAGEEILTGESNIIQQLGGYRNENLYKPTAIELNSIGFNVLANNPLSYYNNQGSTNKIKGVFYSITVTKDGVTFQQPVSKIPYNQPFKVHLIFTGTEKPNKPQYRPNNGEIDVTKNPYKDLPGDWQDSNTKSIFNCTGIDSDQNFEVLVKMGSVDEFRGYFETSATPFDQTGYINEISKLVFSSKHSKIINNQLVLYGGHGYVFFSEYDMFNYFPNYYYIYVASEAGEEAVTGITYFRQYHAIFTNKRIKRMTGTFGADDFGVYPLSDYIGCPNGRTIRPIGNNLLFLGSDGIYKLKQGYLGEGTENIEKIDDVIEGELNLNNVVQAFTMNNNYVVVKDDGRTWIVYNTATEAFYKYDLESVYGIVYDGRSVDENMLKKALPFYSVFQTSLYDEYGDFVLVPMYNYTYNEDHTLATKAGLDVMVFRFDKLDYLVEDKRHSDGFGFISTLETHFMNMGYPMHTKKFKEIYIKMINDSGHAIPLYVTIEVDDTKVIKPDDYIIYYNEENDTFYYVEKIQNNGIIDTSRALGEFRLGVDNMGNKTVQQLKFKVGAKGRGIKVKISDGYDDYTNLLAGSETVKGIPIRQRNVHNFSISSMGIVYKLKKVKEG